IGDNDYKYLGNSVPKYNLGLTNSFVFRSFDLSFLMRSALSFKAVNTKRIFHENMTLLGQQNQFKSALTSPVHDAPTFSSYYLENGNYLKLDNLSLGYTLPLHKNAYLQRIRFAATATNLLIITKFSGMDPELGVSSFNYSGVERNDYYYPRTRSFTFSINADF
ncbi:MAG: TonB-dependent receptor, partial [Bacteroidota bacterium]|nr:TonB-dependent receptor [Bacteroidota bacterium]